MIPPIENQHEQMIDGLLSPPIKEQQHPKSAFRSPFQSEEKKKRSKLNIVNSQKFN